MIELPIADCRLPIEALFAGRGFARGGHYGCQRIGFGKQRGQFLCGHRARFDEQFEPQRGFVSLLLDGSDFSDEFGLAAGVATGTSSVVRFGNGARELDYSQRKSFRAGFEFRRIHGGNLQIQSAIGNRQSAISR